MHAALWLQALALIFLSFLSEDAATWSGAGLAAAGLLPLGLALSACVLGIWLGDLGLFFIARQIGRPFLEFSWVKKRIRTAQLDQAEAWLQRRGVWVLVASRFIPGSRLPIFIAAGLLRFPTWLFAWVTGVMALLWVSGIFLLVVTLGPQTIIYLKMANQGLILGTLLMIAVRLAWILALRWSKNPPTWWERAQRWEFWPASLFYFPVVINYLRLGCKYRGFALPMMANPGIYTGGMIGESKISILRELEKTSPEFTARSVLIQGATLAEKTAFWRDQLIKLQLDYPVVAKPDIGQRGCGFRIIKNETEAEAYLRQIRGGVVLQEYLPGPREIGVFYYRIPGEPSGQIFAITEKIFPVVVGDGQRTVAELIHDDARANLMAGVYRQRHQARLTEILPLGQSLKLVEAGNHAQGCIFRDGQSYWSEQLEARLDQISCGVPGFFIGRYDLRFASVETLKRGTGFKILELNGAASEATNLYDARHSLFTAYKILFQQWELVFAIGAANYRLGHRPEKLLTLWREWRQYQQQSCSYPDAD